MADTVRGDTGTTETIAVGGSRTGTIETAYEQDWYRVSLLANAIYDINVTGNYDTYLYVYNSSGSMLAADDDGGSGLNSYERFTSTGAGTYYLGVGGFSDRTGNFTLSISFVTRLPNAVNDALGSTGEDTALVVNATTLLANDSDPDGNTISVSSAYGAVGGTVSLSGGVISFTPTADYNGAASFQYQISDGMGGFATATASLTITSVADAPDARDDASAPETLIAFNYDGNPNEQGYVFGGFSENSDLGADNSPMAYIAGGIGSMARADGAEFDLNAIWLTGYQAAGDAIIEGYRDGVLVATLTVAVNASIAGGAPVQVSFDSSWDNVDQVNFTLPTGGYLFIDNVEIGVGAGFDVADNGTITIDVLTNDRDVDGDSFTVTAVTNGAHGTTAINADGTVQYTPDRSYSGPDSFTYTITDSTGRTDTATVTVNVVDVNEAPVVANPLADQSSDEDSAVSFTVPADAFSDSDGDALTYSATLEGGAALPDWLTFDAATRSFSGTPPQDYNGALSVTVTASDGAESVSDSFALTITPVNDAPVAAAADESASGAEDQATNGQLLAGTDVEGSTLTFLLVDGSSADGTVSIDPDSGAYSFTPAADFNGATSFQYIVSDGELTSAPKTVTVTIDPVNDAPVVANALADQLSAEDAAVSFTVPADAFADVDGDALTYSATLAGGGALPEWLSFDVATRTFSGTPPLDYNGSIDVTVTASDGSLSASDSFALTITPVNDAPMAGADTGAAQEAGVGIAGANASGNVLINDTDVDAGDTKAVGSASLGATTTTVMPAVLVGAYGTLTLQANGDYAYVVNQGGTAVNALKSGQLVSEVFAYTMVDSGGLTSSSTLTVSLTGANDAPVAMANAAGVSEDATSANLWSTLLANDSDPEATALTIVSVNTAGTLGSVIFNASTQTLQYVANADAFDALVTGSTMTDSFAYTIRDADGATSSATVTMTVTGVNDTMILMGSSGKDWYFGGDGEDRLTGLSGDDILWGMGGHDRLDGGAGADRLDGGFGNDLLIGGTGNDLLTGGAGRDTFQFTSRSGSDTVTDFQVGTDVLNLGGQSIRSSVTGDRNGDGLADLYVTLTGGGSITFLGINSLEVLSQPLSAAPAAAEASRSAMVTSMTPADPVAEAFQSAAFLDGHHSLA